MTIDWPLTRAVVLAFGLFRLVLSIDNAQAFPADDQTGSFGPSARESLSGQDAQDLKHQMQIVTGTAAAPSSGGWVIVPRLDLLGLVTDNALQVSNPRQWDIASIVAPGLAVTADTGRLQLRFDYSPILSVYARTSSQNSLSHYLNTSGLLTVVPDLFFVDLRAVAGVQPISGGFGGINGFGLGLAQASSLGASIANSAILNRQNQSQVLTAGISPYVVREFGDYGILRIGGSLQASSQSTVSGFGTVPLTTTGDDAQSQITTEQTARFITGDILGRIQNTTEGTLSQTPISSTIAASGRQFGRSYSSQQIITNKTAYAINHAITVFATIGYQNLVYSGGLNQSVTGPVWNIGTTLLPNPDSSITVSYGRRDGAESLAFDGKYAVSARTVIAGSYSSSLTTQLQNLQRQLDMGILNANGILVNSQTGAPLIIGNGGQALQPGLFRYDVLNLTAQTTLDRDFLTLAVISSTQRPTTGSTTTSATTVKTISGSWVRELRPDLSLNTIVSYTTQTVSGAPGVGKTLAASIGLNYLLTDSLTGRLRYSYFNRQAGAAIAINPAFSRFSFSQNLLTIGITKLF